MRGQCPTTLKDNKRPFKTVCVIKPIATISITIVEILAIRLKDAGLTDDYGIKFTDAECPTILKTTIKARNKKRISIGKTTVLFI